VVVAVEGATGTAAAATPDEGRAARGPDAIVVMIEALPLAA
jgi:hypothetical protein